MHDVSSSKPVLHIKKVYRPPKSHPWKKSFKLLNPNIKKKKKLSKIEKESIKEIENYLKVLFIMSNNLTFQNSNFLTY